MQNVSLIRRYNNNRPCVHTHTGRAKHACLHKQTQLPDNKLWLRNQIENVIKYDGRRERGRFVCEKSTIIISVRPSGSAPLGSHCPYTLAGKQTEANSSTRCHHVLSQSICLRLSGSNQLWQIKYLWRVFRHLVWLAGWLLTAQQIAWLRGQLLFQAVTCDFAVSHQLNFSISYPLAPAPTLVVKVNFKIWISKYI